MGKKCVTTFSLVQEADVWPPDKIRQDMESELRQILHRVPWAKEIENVEILEQHRSK